MILVMVVIECFVVFSQRKKGLNQAGDPEKTHKTGHKHKHFEHANVGPGKMAFCKQYTDYQKGSKPDQLIQLQTGNIGEKFILLQINC